MHLLMERKYTSIECLNSCILYPSITVLIHFVFLFLTQIPTSLPVLLPGKSHGLMSPVGCRPWRHTELDTTEATLQQQQPASLHLYKVSQQNIWSVFRFLKN